MRPSLARALAFALLSVAMSLSLIGFAACGDGPKAPTAASPSSSASASPSATQPGIPTAGPGVAATCPSIASEADVSALVGQTMTAGPSPEAQAPGANGTIVCRWESFRQASPDLNFIIVFARYPDATTAINAIAKTRIDSQANGITFTKLDGIGEESYAISSPTFRGFTSRRATLGVTINIGTSLKNANDDQIKAALKKLIEGGG